MRALALEMGVISWDVRTPTLLSFPFLFSPPFPMFHHIQTAAYIHILRNTHISYLHLFLFTIPYLYSLAWWHPPIPQFWYSLSLVNRWASSLYPILFPFSNIILFHWWIVLSVSLSRFPLGSTSYRSIHLWQRGCRRLGAWRRKGAGMRMMQLRAWGGEKRSESRAYLRGDGQGRLRWW